jgi:hypothetical protein
MTGDLWQKVDAFSKSSRLSRSQVVERALLAYFGEHVQEAPFSPPEVIALRAAEKPNPTSPRRSAGA